MSIRRVYQAPWCWLGHVNARNLECRLREYATRQETEISKDEFAKLYSSHLRQGVLFNAGVPYKKAIEIVSPYVSKSSFYRYLTGEAIPNTKTHNIIWHKLGIPWHFPQFYRMEYESPLMTRNELMKDPDFHPPDVDFDYRFMTQFDKLYPNPGYRNVYHDGRSFVVGDRFDLGFGLWVFEVWRLSPVYEGGYPELPIIDSTESPGPYREVYNIIVMDRMFNNYEEYKSYDKLYSVYNPFDLHYDDDEWWANEFYKRVRRVAMYYGYPSGLLKRAFSDLDFRTVLGHPGIRRIPSYYTSCKMETYMSTWPGYLQPLNNLFTPVWEAKGFSYWKESYGDLLG